LIRDDKDKKDADMNFLKRGCRFRFAPQMLGPAPLNADELRITQVTSESVFTGGQPRLELACHLAGVPDSPGTQLFPRPPITGIQGQAHHVFCSLYISHFCAFLHMPI